jgi:hypothetical protein
MIYYYLSVVTTIALIISERVHIYSEVTRQLEYGTGPLLAKIISRVKLYPMPYIPKLQIHIFHMDAVEQATCGKPSNLPDKIKGDRDVRFNM